MVNYQRTMIALAGLMLPLAAGIQVNASIVGCKPTNANRPVCPGTAAPETATFIDPTVRITAPGKITLAEKVYVGPFAQLLAGDDGGITIDKESNVQDNVTIYGGFERNDAAEARVEALGLDEEEGVEIAERVILAHGATVKGPAMIGVGGGNIAVDPDADQEVFLSFGSEVDGAILEKNTGVSALGRVGPGVRLRSGFIVLPGKNVTTQAQADDPSLGKVRLLTEADIAFSEGVIAVGSLILRGQEELMP